MAEKTPFTPASIYRGKNLADSVKAAGYSSVPEFSVTLREKGLPNIGQTGGQESLELLNKQIRSKPNFNPDDIYLAVQDDVKKIQTEVLGTTAQTKGNRGIRQQITNTLDDIQKSFLTVAEKVKLKGQERIKAIADEIVQKIPKVTPATAFKAATNIFKSLVIGGPLTGADVMSRQANEEAMQTLFPTQQTFAGGGMASMDDMTRPLGYKEAGEVGIKERIYRALAPKDKESDEELKLRGINPDSVLPEEREISKDQPEGVMQGIFGELFGGRGAEGASLMSDMDDMKLLLMKHEILSSDVGTRAPISVIKDIDLFGPDELQSLYNIYGGDKFRTD